MWTTLACVAALSLTPGQAGKLALTNVSSTQGLLGTPRSSADVMPGDILILAFEIQNLTVGADGEVTYAMQMQVVDKAGKVWFKQDPKPIQGMNSLGGTSAPAFAHVHIGLDQPADDYMLVVTVTDQKSAAKQKPTASLKYPFKVIPLKFGLVRLQITYMAADAPETKVTPPIGVPGQILWVNFATVGFKRDPKTNDPNLKLTMVVKDEKGKPALAQPFTGEASKDIPKNFQLVPMQFFLHLNRSGKFTVELVGEDKVSGSKATLSFPLTVLAR